MIFRMSRDTQMTPELLAKYIQKAKNANAKRFDELARAYRCDYKILKKKKNPAWKPDNRIAVNYAKYIVDTFNGFFIGNPVKTSCDEQDVAQACEYIEKSNDQDDNNAELAKLMSIYGRGYEMYFVDENKQLGITYVSPRESFMIYDEGIVEEPLYFVHWYINQDNVEMGSYSDAQYVYNFERRGGTYIMTGEPIAHGFDGVPAAEFIENDERMGIFESVMTLIDAYNKAISEKANDVDYFADAYLKVLGVKMDEEDLGDLRNQRIINLEGAMDNIPVVDFMEKPNADTTQENLLSTLERLIYQIAMVPNINDQSFGTSSGIAMQYKLLNTSNMFKTKQRKFESGMNRRWRLIFSHQLMVPWKVKEDDWTKLRYRFTPNIPANVLEEAQTAAQLSGIVSKRTQLETLSVVDNVESEMRRIEEENQPVDLLNFNAHAE
jgi:SPP1 family phage portal protein